MSRPACRRNYFEIKSDNLSLLDTVVGAVGENPDTGVPECVFTFPYPFQLMGLCDIVLFAPDPQAEFPMNQNFTFLPTADQNTNATWIQQMFIAMMYANRDAPMTAADIASYPFGMSIIYTEEAWMKFSGYFYNYLNIDIKKYYYNNFLWPLSLMIDFWNRENTTPVPSTLQDRFRQLCLDQFNLSDRRLWGAPGRYAVQLVNSDPAGLAYTLDIEVIPR